jgi:hypothetical protein
MDAVAADRERRAFFEPSLEPTPPDRAGIGNLPPRARRKLLNVVVAPPPPPLPASSDGFGSAARATALQAPWTSAGYYRAQTGWHPDV